MYFSLGFCDLVWQIWQPLLLLRCFSNFAFTSTKELEIFGEEMTDWPVADVWELIRLDFSRVLSLLKLVMLLLKSYPTFATGRLSSRMRCRIRNSRCRRVGKGPRSFWIS